MGVIKFDSHKWPTVLVDEVKGKPCNFKACSCGSLYSPFTTSFYPSTFYNKRLQTLFKDQLDRSKATCSFNTICIFFVRRQLTILLYNLYNHTFSTGIFKVQSTLVIQRSFTKEVFIKRFPLIKTFLSYKLDLVLTRVDCNSCQSSCSFCAHRPIQLHFTCTSNIIQRF